MMTRLDQQVGQLLALLKELDIDDNTLVMLSSDNGPHKEGGHQPDFFDSNGPLRGYKRDLYEGGIRVPMIARWPGTIPSGRVTSLISGFQDILPTVAELCTADKPSHLDGVSLVPELLGKPGQQQHEFLYWEFSEQQGKRAVLQGDWKLVQLKVSTQKPSGFELYNVADDVSEANDVAAAHPEIVKRLSALLEGAHVPSRQYPLFAWESE